jgi:hypothetical protein
VIGGAAWLRDGQALAAHAALRPDDRLVASATAALRLDWPTLAAMATLDAGGQLRLTDSGPAHAALHLEQGRLHSRFAPQAGRRWLVDTDEASVLVTGTIFSVQRQHGLTSVAVERGSVQVQPRQGPPQSLAAPARLHLTAGGPVTTTPIAQPALRDASGLVVVGETLWSHNDRGNAPVLYAFHRDGSAAGELRLAGVPAGDWEDLGRCNWRGQDWLVLGDIGGTRVARQEVAVHLLALPTAPGAGRTASAAPLRSLVIAWPDGLGDSDACAADGARGELLLWDKRPAAATVLVADLGRDGPQTARVLARMPYGPVRGAAIAGDRCLILVGQRILGWRRGPGAAWDFSRVPDLIQELPPGPQAEGLAVADDGTVLLTGEAPRPALLALPSPGR